MASIGYMRVSTKDQTIAAQKARLHAADCVKFYAAKASAAKTERAELGNLLKRLEPGDVLIVTRLDVLARSTRDLLNILDMIAGAGAGFKSLDETWADTTTAHGRLILTVIGGLAQFQRELIRARTGEGRARAKASGARFGRPHKLAPHQRQEALQRLAVGETQADVARTYNVDQTTIGRLLPFRRYRRSNLRRRHKK